MSSEGRRDFRAMRTESEASLADTLFQLLEEKGIAYSDLIKQIEDDYGVDLNSGNLTNYKKKKMDIPIVVVFEACKLLNITVDDFLKIAWKELHIDGVKKTSSLKAEKSSDDKKGNLLTIALPSDDSLVSNPSNKAFRGYDGKYYIYFAPTASSDRGYLKGFMTVTPRNTNVYVKFEITHHCCDGEIYDVEKIYEGSFIISTSVRCCYCILSSSDVGELCFLAFRYFSINRKKLECRIAEALTVSAGTEDRYPTVHRVLISREEIKDEDIIQLLPLLKMNSSTIIIPKDELEVVSKRCAKNQMAVEELVSTPGVEQKAYYCIREDMISTITQNMKTVGKKHALPLILDIRERAESSRYNKVSRKADAAVRNFLKQRGYFKNP